MPWKRKLSGGVLALIGFMLSPLTWWNDLFVNIPLALLFAWIVSIFSPRVFEASFIVGYWLTNIIGLVLLQKGGEAMLAKEYKPYTRRAFLRDLAVSLLYTGVIVLLLGLEIFKPISNYLEGR